MLAGRIVRTNDRTNVKCPRRVVRADDPADQPSACKAGRPSNRRVPLRDSVTPCKYRDSVASVRSRFSKFALTQAERPRHPGRPLLSSANLKVRSPMKRGLVLGSVIAIGALSIALAAFQAPAGGGQGREGGGRGAGQGRGGGGGCG